MKIEMTLKELIYYKQMLGLSDLEIIKQWFIINNCEQEGNKYYIRPF